MIVKQITTTIILSLLCVAARTQSIFADTNMLKTKIEGLAKKYNVPGAAVIVTQNGASVFSYEKQKGNLAANYLIGSCTKSFTALAILQLAQRNMLHLDSPVVKYLSWFSLQDAVQSKKITVRHLLNQTGGIKRGYGYFDYTTTDEKKYIEELSKYLHQIELSAAPGATFNYSNLNYLLLGLIVNATAGKTYSQFVTENIFNRVNMPGSRAAFSGTQAAGTIQPYHYLFFNTPFKTGTYTYSDFAVPYGHISSNATDLTRYVNSILNNGITINGDTLLAAPNYTQLITPALDGYAMGWTKNNYHGTDFINHLGLNENFSSGILVCPSKKIGMVVLSNVNSFEFCNEVQYLILSDAINKPYTPAASVELMRRKGIAIAVSVLFIGLLINFFRWKKYRYRFGVVSKFLPVARLSVGIVLSLAGLIILPKMNDITLKPLINHQPDFGYGLIGVAIIGVASAVLRYAGTFGKLKTIKKY
jgi:CubicO group peptidase (beta-lactamase class C family)